MNDIIDICVQALRQVGITVHGPSAHYREWDIEIPGLGILVLSDSRFKLICYKVFQEYQEAKAHA